MADARFASGNIEALSGGTSNNNLAGTSADVLYTSSYSESRQASVMLETLYTNPAPARNMYALIGNAATTSSPPAQLNGVIVQILTPVNPVYIGWGTPIINSVE